MEADAELITGRKVRRKNGNQKRRNNGHGGTEFCKSRAMGAGLSLFLNAGDGIELWLVDLPFEGGQFFAGCVCRRACCRGPGRSGALRRLFAIAVQNRVIRLEERMRLERLLPADLKARIGEFTCGQLVAMRFACDAELPALARKVLADNIQGRNAIKQMVQTSRADYLSA